jgi:DNA-binding response OmpR family regulator
VSEAGTVTQALAQLSGPPDWVLLDLMLPDGSGVDVIRKVREEKIATRICIITGCAPDVLNEARLAGAEHAFTKPLNVDRLMTVLGS